MKDYYSPVKDLPSKKQRPSRKVGLIIVAIAIVLIVVVTLVATNFGSNVYRISQPAATSFRTTEWMQYLPSNIVAFRFLNISSLVNVSGLFNSTTLVDLDQLNMSLTPYDIEYGVEIYTLNESNIHVMALNESCLDQIASSLANQGLIHITYQNVTIYYLHTHPTSGEGGSWFCIDKGAIIFSGMKDTDVVGIKQVIDANDTSFFNSDALKIGYLLTSNGKPNQIFSYYAWEINSYNLDIEMRSASNSTTLLEVRNTYHFLRQSDFDAAYDYFLKNILSSARTIYVSPLFITSQYVYNQEVWSSLVSAL
jgi:hypothetical protein